MNKSVQKMMLAGQFLMILALEMTNPFLPLLIAQKSNTPIPSVVIYNMLSLILPMVANILLTPIWGLAADRYGYKSMLMRASWALVLTQASMIFVNSVFWILIIRLIQGAFAGFLVAMQTYALSITEWQNKSTQLSRLQSSKAIATSTAGFIGGLALSFTNYQGLFGLATLICLGTTVAMHYKLPSSTKRQIKNSSQTSHHPLTSKSVFFFLCVLIMLAQIAKFLPDPGFTLFVNKYCSNNLVLIGFLYSLPSIGMLCSSVWCGKQFDHCRSQPSLVNQYLIRYSVFGTVLMIIQANVDNFYLFGLIRILWGIVLAALLPALFALCSDRNLLPGYALGLANSFAKLGNLIGLLLGGIFAFYLPYPAIFMIIAGIYSLFAIFVYGYGRVNIRQMTDFSKPYFNVKS
ncbi:MFS transporter [Legionella pneumophila]|uniref:Multidrug resistance efflux pump n=1 Tax=Legionella pneumophila subsp. pascullei TaxID=91890 RepID=A0AAX2IV46_LEGPN|nr:MFS transporter [Legionella pneumophila]AMP90023.1 MFS transporter [Legionella pneumophila subsp. pascullei]AMP92311.1 MFS transporter [Legionella pneumophila subsp. pascullei]AMP95276.1 MFS transporter [Legionella pneumophila subsp. pascullei]SQG90170.1 multidrug resistance efflux pump [Legionella pneumophila subsp. pascullei]VEH06175.1 multidrug resistance efflux pump [Legionella pneumophila subsp. pascullei]